MFEMLRDSLAGTFSLMTSRVSTAVNLLDEHCVVHVWQMVQAHVSIYVHCLGLLQQAREVELPGPSARLSCWKVGQGELLPKR